MFLIRCPWCGCRDQSEYSYGGEAHRIRPLNSLDLNDADWADYLFMRSNPIGLYRERWVHSSGCGQWFNVIRHTKTDQIITEYKISEFPETDLHVKSSSSAGYLNSAKDPDK